MPDRTPSRILVLYENSRRGTAAIDQAAELALQEGALLTVVAVAVLESEDPTCCDTRAGYWNGVVKGLAADDLEEARRLFGRDPATEFRLAYGRSVPEALALEAERCRAGIILVPSNGGIHPWSRRRRARQVQRRAPDAVVIAAAGSRRSG